MQAELGTPLREGHPEILAEQAGQRAVARSDLPAQLGEGAVVRGIGAQQVADPAQQRIVRRGQMQGLLHRDAQLVEEHPRSLLASGLPWSSLRV